jgi:hypothetical protein
MTLVVARANEAGLVIVSDTRASFASRDAARPRDVMRSPGPIHGVLKAIILNHAQCLCFSGEVEVAYAMLHQLVADGLHLALDDEPILQRLLTTHVDREQRVDFLLASVLGAPTLHEVKDGALRRDVGASWLGSAAAYSAYQRHYAESEHSAPGGGEPEKRQLGRVQDAMHRLLEGEQAFEDVGDFLVTVRSAPHGLVYIPYASAWFPTFETSSEEWVTVDMGTAATGAYSYGVLCPKDSGGLPFVAVYFAHGEFGVVFSPFESSDAFVCDARTPDEFVAHVERVSGVELGGIIMLRDHVIRLRRHDPAV